MDTGRKKRKNLLSIDGGISGLPALYILDEMLARLQFDLKLDEELLACERFDMIMATGPGAIIAMLIGRLRLTISKAIEAYVKLMSVLPMEPAKDDEERKHNTDELEKVLRDILVGAEFDPDSPMLIDNEPRIIICAANTANLSTLHSIRSYRARGALLPVCSILQAALAAVAYRDRFIPVTIGSGHRKATLTDAMVGYANPSKELLREAQDVFGDEIEVATIVSIGTGKFNTETEIGINEVLNRGSAVCEQVHEELQTRLEETDVYHRFNIDKYPGFEPEVVAARVSSYVGERVVSSRLNEAIKSLEARPKGVTLKSINSVSTVNISLKPRPSLVRNFIGREDILELMRRTHITNREAQVQTPAITVLSGIGGSGKTQIALKFALEFESLHPDASVYFLNASSEDSLKTDLEVLIRSLGSSYRTKSFEDALVYLATEVKNWLMIFDNADNPSVRLFPFIPKCTHGNLIITTRNSNHAILSPNGHHHVEGLSTDEAIELILSLSRNGKTEPNRAIARQIVEELGCLPLALAQAGGYIFVNKCLSQYLDMYRKNRAELLESSKVELPQDYQSTVATTIRMSMTQLPAEAQDLMRLFAELDATSIAHEIIAKAANHHFKSVVSTEEEDVDPRTLECAKVLMKIICPSGEWSEVGFGEIIGRCLQYSLLRLTTQGEARFYSMHVLVQSYLQSYQQPIQHFLPKMLTIRLLGAATTEGQIYEHIALNRLLAPHLKRVDRRDITEPGDHFGFGDVFYDVGDMNSSIAHKERCVEMWRDTIGEEHENILAAMTGLASSYRETGSSRKALEIEENLLEIYKRRFGSESSGTLSVMNNLALSYQALGLYQEALKLDEESLEISKRKLGTKHPDTLTSMHNLAMCYKRLGRHQESLELREKLVDMWKSVLGPEHPHTLMAISNLAASYTAVGRYQEAVDLDEEALEIRKRVLGLEHPNTLDSMQSLSVSHWDVGRHPESLELGRVVLELRIRISGQEHPGTLHTMRNHLGNLRDLGMMEEMHELLRVALPLHEKALGIDHPTTMRFKKRFQGFIDTTDSQ